MRNRFLESVVRDREIAQERNLLATPAAELERRKPSHTHGKAEPRKARRPRTKVTPEMAAEIHRRRRAGESFEAIAAALGIAVATTHRHGANVLASASADTVAEWPLSRSSGTPET